MRKCLYVIFLIVFLPSLSIAQIDVDTIFVWDNDRGKSVQTKPAVGIIGENFSGGFPAWQDARWGDFDIFRQRFAWDSTLIGSNIQVSFDDFNQFQQTNVDITGNPQNRCIAVWEDSAYRPNEKPAQIWCRIYNDDPIKVYELDASQKLPAISSRMNGYFAVTWTCYNGAPWPSILCKCYDDTGHELGFNVVRERDSIVEYPPISRVAYCDSGFIIVYEDESNDGTERSIYAQYCDKDGNIMIDHEKISRLSGDSRHEQCPDVAINENGNIVVVWEDYRNVGGDADIYVQRLQALNDGFEFVGLEMEIMTTGGVHELCPRIAVFPNGSFVVVWYDKRSGDYDVFYRAFIGGELRTPHRIPQNNGNDQMYPNIDTRYGEYSDYISMVWASQAISMYDDVFMRNFRYDDQAGTGLDSLTNDIPLVPMNPDTGVGGRKCWYFDDENYDNPATAWNEDPIPEPESVYVDLDFAIIDQLMELNTNGQYYIECEDTLPFNQGLQDRALAAYEAIFLDLGYRTDDASAGLINSIEQSALVTYIGNKNPTMVEGNDFGRDYSGTALFDKYGAQYMGDGAPYTTGNIDTLYGSSGSSFEDLAMAYDYQELVDNYPDSVRAKVGYQLMLYSTGGLDRWMVGRSVGWGSYWDETRERDPDSFTIFHAFMMSGIKGTTHPNTYAEFYRRCLGYLGLNCQPEPITTLTASNGSFEGELNIEWQVVSDDDPSQSAEGDYKLKFARTKMTSETEFNNAEEYYQEWNTASQSVGELVSKTLYGLPPGDILIFALKVSDESGMWGALGAEPRDTVFGDTITPHSVCVGDNYVKDFLNTSELLDMRYDDTLFITWDASNFYVGFARCSFKTEGDLFIYIDVDNADGVDSTYPYHGWGTRSWFSPGTFKPDYLFILEDSATMSFKQGTDVLMRDDSWSDASFSGDYSEDSTINDFRYTEVRIPFADMGYNPADPFKLVVLIQEEASNNIKNAYPILNPVGGNLLNISQYYEWSALPAGVSPRQTSSVIGVQEATDVSSILLKGKTLSVLPNPFSDRTEISLGSLNSLQSAQNVVLTIYDVSGRLVKTIPVNLGKQKEARSSVYWDGTDDNGHTLAGGVYFCELTTGEQRQIEKIIFIK